MKNMKILVIIILIALSCKESKIEVINDELEYFQIEMLDPPISDSVILSQTFSGEMKNFIKNLNNQHNETLIMLKAEYTLFIGLEGRVDKIKPRIRSSETRLEPSQLILSNNQQLTDFLVEYFRKNSLPIGYNDGQKVKYQFNIQKVYYSNKEDDSIIMDQLNDVNKDVVKKSDLFLLNVDYKSEPVGGMQSIFKNLKYPEIAKRAGIQGKVLVRAYINEKGNVVNVEIIKSAHEALDSAAVNAVLKTKFKPGMLLGKPVKTQVAIPIVFTLK